MSLQSSQIDTSVAKSESEVEDPLAESSVSFFSGYEQTPKHQVEQAKDISQQDSWTAPPDLCQDSLPGGMDPEATQAEQPPVQDATSMQPVPPSTVPEPPEPLSEPPPAVNPPQQQPLSGPPVSQKFPAPMESEQPAAVDEMQPFYNQQPSWNDQEPSRNDSHEEPSWNDSHEESSRNDSHEEPSRNDSHEEPSWNDRCQSEVVRHEKPKKVEPPPPKGIV